MTDKSFGNDHARRQMGHWCEFCQTYHSSQSCYHPGGHMLRMAEARIESLESACERYRQKNAELIGHIDRYDKALSEAEAEVERLQRDLDSTVALYAEMKGEAERLKRELDLHKRNCKCIL